MTSNAIRRWKTLFLMGALLTILGSFLPWVCYGGFTWYCPSGLDINLGALALINPSMAVMTVVILIAVILIMSEVDMIQQWRIEISVIIIVFPLLYFLMDKKIVTDNGGLTVIILCGIALWRFFRIVELTWRSDLVIIASTLLLVIVSTYRVISILLKQIIEDRIFEGTSLEFGLQIVFIGSLLMLAPPIVGASSSLSDFGQKQIGKS